MTLLQIIEKTKKNRRTEKGDFGIEACKEHIIFCKDCLGEGLYIQLEKYVKRANEDPCFNKRMVLACWELINEEYQED